ncbi:oxalyl-CoA decarboxylase [Schizosaccharomyces japonicus yFS275]|uniref:2-hydroxyacyl-CoA lyase n=1 Tax=Schizosaccharomyces japonicus (strain yFS275 / FY16936) TaxID=402676 RepID=B6JWD2_SCHJY|nr:oxalyl-CoA decarboxylase [Schizosaccharomyces japonicus yFS275]EEB05683.2 oxalyl-CoA decarboxylase [Schizosaccharomyces japonicus yFS275]
MKKTCSEVIAETLVSLQVKYVFGIVGIPVIQVAEAIRDAGIHFVSFRNEQSAAYAATAYAYLTKKPAFCLVVGGPGVIHAMAGVFNANNNRWPLVLLAGSSETSLRHMGAFQEFDQVSFLTPHTKFAARPPSIQLLPSYIQRAYRVSHFGTPGTAYVDLPADLIESSTASEDICIPSPSNILDSPVVNAAEDVLNKVADILIHAKAPLIVVGKGVAYSKAEDAVYNLVEKSGIPFLPTPMGKGCIPETHPLNASAARSSALKSADVVILLGARLNWLLHFGKQPRWSQTVRFIQVDTCAEELGNNTSLGSTFVWADIACFANQLSTLLEKKGYKRSPSVAQYVNSLAAVRKKNEQKALNQLQSSTPLRMNYSLHVMNEVLTLLSKNSSTPVTWVSEGANTMDRSRLLLHVSHARGRLDAGTTSTMGLGMGYSIATALANPNHRVVSVFGDSAFGFSAMEVETAIRNKLNIIIIILNNNGIYHGLDADSYKDLEEKNQLPTTALSVATRYDAICQACGGQGFFVQTEQELKDALTTAWKTNNVSLINVMIDPESKMKLIFNWMQETKKPVKL